MTKKIILIVLTIIICIIIVKLTPPSEKEHVKQDIETLREAVEKKDTTVTFSYIDESYSDKNFVSFDELKKGINAFFADFDSINIGMSNINIYIDSTDFQKTIFASCSLGLKVIGEYEKEKVILYGGIIKPAPVRVCLKKSEGHYKIYYAEY